MSEPDMLAKLHDIKLPLPISWWPLAPGWYILAMCLLGLVFIIGFYVYRLRIQGQAKRFALQFLDDECRNLKGDSRATAAMISALLRRVALVYFPREQVASLQNDDWIDFLNREAKGVDFNTCRDCLLILPYKPNHDADLTLYIELAKTWIKQRGVPCSS